MAYWILKTEPSSYSYEQLEKDGSTVWDGVRNFQAQAYIKRMKAGDEMFIYHSGDGKCIVGTAEVLGDPFADPKDKSLSVMKIAAKGAVKKPVSLSQIKADPKFAELKLVRQSRLSVVPVPDQIWKALWKMTGGLR